MKTKEKALFDLVDEFHKSGTNRQTEIIYQVYNLGFTEMANALAETVYGESFNWQKHYDTITPNWKYVQAGRADIKTRQNERKNGNIFRVGQKWKSEIQEAWRFCKAAHNGHYISFR